MIVSVIASHFSILNCRLMMHCLVSYCDVCSISHLGWSNFMYNILLPKCSTGYYSTQVINSFFDVIFCSNQDELWNFFTYLVTSAFCRFLYQVDFSFVVIRCIQFCPVVWETLAVPMFVASWSARYITTWLRVPCNIKSNANTSTNIILMLYFRIREMGNRDL